MKTVMLAGVVAMFISGPAWGRSWVRTPPQVLVDQADFVVRGTIVDGNEATGQANIKVEETLKGGAKEKIPVQFAVKKMAELKTFYENGPKGIWILERPDKDGRYDLDYPWRRMQVEEIDKAKALVETFRAIKWSKPMNGLAGAVRVCTTGNVNVKPVHTFDLYLAVKNVSDKSLTVQQTEGGLDMHFTLKGPDGERAINMPEMKAAGLPKSVVLEPGQVIYVGFAWPKGLRTGALMPGDYTATGTYSFLPEAPPVGQWTGTLQTEPLELNVGK